MKQKLKCIIVDDEKLARDLLEDLIRHEKRLELIARCKNTFELEQALATHSPDLIYLDIQMPKETGAQFLRRNDLKAKVIFTTAYRNYAIEGFELDVLDYLLKPITEERFKKSLQKVYQAFTIEEKARVFDLIEESKEQSITIKSGYDEYKLLLSEILFIESDGEYVRYHTQDKKYLVLTALKKLEKQLPEQIFIRTHRSYIVRKDLIKGREGYELILKDNTRVPIGKTYRKKVLEEIVI